MQTVCLRRTYDAVSAPASGGEISCDRYRWKMTGSAVSEQIDQERNSEKLEGENEGEEERQVVSATIQLPSELD